MVKTNRCIQITLVLNEEEAWVLRNIMKNPIRHIVPGDNNLVSESMRECKFRGELFHELDGQLEGFSP